MLSGVSLLGLVRIGTVVPVGLIGLVGVELSRAIILDVGDVSVVTINGVNDLLEAAVREVHVVGTLGVVTVTVFLVPVFVFGRFVIHGPLEAVLGLRRLVGLLRRVSL